MEFIKQWNEAIESDPYWQFEELLEAAPELAEYIWYLHWLAIMVEKRMNFLEQLKRVAPTEGEKERG